VVPRRMRDAVYGLIARRRYRWFGRRDQCFVPASHMRDRFVAD
jgi:predicted DCC family thiol-disulfide oxidoreductase YuxK